MHRDFWNTDNNYSFSENNNSRRSDKDILLLAALIYLLIKDGADRELILALVYVMM